MTRYFLALIAGLIIVLSSCDPNTVYEEKKDFKEGYWLWKEPVEFTFEINNANASYDFSYFVRNELDFPYQNVYLQYYLEDSLGNVLKKDLNNVVLFDPKTGMPEGSGFGDTYDTEKLFLEDYQFPRVGKYNIRIDQFMRPDTLLNIKAIGIKIEKSPETED